MLPDRRLRVLAAALLVAAMIPSTLWAEPGSLKWPTVAASAAATADWASTYHALKFYKVREQNPMLRPWDATPGRMVTLGGAIDAAGISAWNLTMGKKHDRIAAAGLWTMTAFRVYLAVHNARNERRAERR
jgi:hypothetical protein